MYLNFLFVFIVFLQNNRCSHGFYVENKSDYLSIKCKDNQDAPVDWWYIYKPPKDSGRYLESRGNFTFITSDSMGRFQPSSKNINHNSMLQYTLAPLYNKPLNKYLAIMAYGDTYREVDPQTSTAFGFMFANSLGGVWISHTIPGFPNLDRSPELIMDEGHMIMCLSLDLKNLNTIATAVRHTDSQITQFALPDRFSLYLQEWALLETNAKPNAVTSSKTKLLSFSTQGKTLNGLILARGPDDPRCLYETFAKLQGLVIDVYNKDNSNTRPICETDYSLRYIHKISLKFPEQQICYIDKNYDRLNFGVSTAAIWQRSSRNSRQYWTCTGSDNQKGHIVRGGLIICAENYPVWFGFDNLKVKEPEC